MSAVYSVPPAAGDSLPRKLFTRDEVQHMQDRGLFEGLRFELIDGELIDKTGQNPPHAIALSRIADWLFECFGRRRVRVQLPVEASTPDQSRSLPEPDVAVIQAAFDDEWRHPRAEETLLIVEVADSTVQRDSTVKQALYARAKAPEYWVLDIGERLLTIYRNPVGDRYVDVEQLGDDGVASVAGQDAAIAVSALLPRKSN